MHGFQLQQSENSAVNAANYFIGLKRIPLVAYNACHSHTEMVLNWVRVNDPYCLAAHTGNKWGPYWDNMISHTERIIHTPPHGAFF